MSSLRDCGKSWWRSSALNPSFAPGNKPSPPRTHLKSSCRQEQAVAWRQSHTLPKVQAAFQILDVLTTLIGFRYGAAKGSYFVSRLLQFGPVAGLLMSKGIALALAVTAIALERENV
jgi:hypothetical protein